MGKIEEKKQQKKRALLDAAYLLFTQKGVDDTSVAGITAQAKMAKGTFYLYFKDKYEIKDYLVAEKANQVFQNAIGCMEREAWYASAKASIEDCVMTLTDAVLDYLEQNPSLLKFIEKNLSWGVFSSLQIDGTTGQNCMELIDSLLEASPKQFRQKDLMIYMIIELINATCHSVILNGVPVALSDLKPALYRAVRGIMGQFEIAPEDEAAGKV